MKRIFFVVAAVIISSQLWSQDTTGRILDEAVITAGKFEQKQSQTGKVITVINKEELEKNAGKTLGQLLQEQAGLTISGANNATGSVQTVFMRGASSGRTLILLDGIPVSDPSMIYNEFDLNLISIHDIERIEICRGAQSTLYGSDAIAGVINIITVKKDVTKPFHVKATTIFGNKNTWRNNLQLFGKINNKLTYTTRFARMTTDGFSSAHDSTGIKDYERDGYKGNDLNAALQYQVIPELSARVFVQRSWYDADVDAGLFADEKDFTIHSTGFTTGGGLQFKKGILSLSGNYQYGKIRREYLNDSVHVPGFMFFEANNYDSKTRYAELYGNVKISSWLTVLAGFDHRKGRMSQDYKSISGFGPYNTRFNDTSLHQNSLYASLFLSAVNKKLNVELGVRNNENSKFGNNTTFTFNPSYIITDNWRVFGSIATGFKAPSIYQIYDAFSGNPDLRPEKSTNYEFGVQETHKKISTRFVFFYREIENGIDFNYISFRYFNFVKQTIYGLELELTAHPTDKLSLNANYTYIKGEEKTQSRKDFTEFTYEYLLRRPEHSIHAGIGYQFCTPFYARLSAHSVSSRYDVGGFMADDVLVDSYFLLNAYAEYKWKSRIKFFADLQNITDKKFFDIRGFNAIPFLISGGIHFNW